MKKLIVLAASAALLASVSMSSFAAGKTPEERCKAQAEKHKIAEDKMDAYVKTCVEKHTKKAKKADTTTTTTTTTPAPAAPTAPAAPAK